MRLFIFLFLWFSSFILWAAEMDFDKQQIQQRIAPIGQVNVEEEAADTQKATEQTQAEEVAEKQVPGKATYEQYCLVCHRDGLAGAPKFENKEDWQPRLSAKKLDGLLTSAKNGLNAMPAKGTCMDCSDEDLKIAIQYMLPKS
ncbi:MAG: cytochrome c5 family protein [Legionella sp.]|nr:MAG: cytochrome c5 family protein [Legionella sp.]